MIKAMIKRGAEMLVIISMTGLVGGCNRETSPETIDMEKIEAAVEAQSTSRQEREIALAAKEEPSSGVVVLVEYIEVPKSLANEFMQENPLEADGDSFRKQAQIWLKAEQAVLSDMMVVRGQSGERATAKSVHEVIYPGAFVAGAESVEDPEDVDESSDDKKVAEKKTVIKLPPSPLNFDTREVGSILEVDAVKGGDGEITLNVRPESSMRLARNSWEIKTDDSASNVESPTFHSAGVQTTINLKNGRYAFLGTGKLPEEKQTAAFGDSILLMFVRADSF